MATPARALKGRERCRGAAGRVLYPGGVGARRPSGVKSKLDRRPSSGRGTAGLGMISVVMLRRTIWRSEFAVGLLFGKELLLFALVERGGGGL